MRGNPFEDLEEAIERMSRQFEGGMELGLGGGVPVDVVDRDAEYVVTADLPGFSPDDIDVTLEDGVLHIEADREAEAGTEESEEADENGGRSERYIYQERTHESVSRTVRLPEAVDEAAVTASHSNGVLTVELPKERHDDDEGHTIEVE